MLSRSNIIKLSVSLIIISRLTFANLYVNPYESKAPCNRTKEKVTNKVPVYELCSWNKIEWENLIFRNDVDTTTRCNDHGADGNYIVEKNIPSKFLIYKDLVFVIIFRTIGVYSSLNYFHISDISKDKVCPKLNAYPNNVVNQLAVPGTCPDSPDFYINVVDMQIDKCGILYIMDGGFYIKDSLFTPEVLATPEICRYNTSKPASDALIDCKIFPKNLVTPAELYGYTTIIVNVIDGCDKAYVYVINILSGTCTVLSLETGEFWTFPSILFRAEPDASLLKVSLPDYSCKTYVAWSGVSGVLTDTSLSFAVRPSTTFYTMRTKVLNDKSNAHVTGFTYNIKETGSFGENGQINSMVLYKDVIIASQEQQQAIVCFNTSTQVSQDNIQYLVRDSQKYPYISDVRLNSNKPGCKRAYFLTNNQLDIQCNGFDTNIQNFRIFYFNINEALQLYPECKRYYKEMQQPTPTIDYKIENQYVRQMPPTVSPPCYRTGAKTNIPPSPYQYVPQSPYNV